MAKMKIFEIARSIQAKNKEIKSGDLVKLLNENGFDVKGANSNIEDKEIAFLLQTFNDPKKVEKILASQKAESSKPEKDNETKAEKKEPKVSKEAVTPAEPAKEQKSTTEQEKKPEEKAEQKPVPKEEKKKEQKEENTKKVPETEQKKEYMENDSSSFTGCDIFVCHVVPCQCRYRGTDSRRGVR